MPELRTLTLEEMKAYNTLSSICFTYTTPTENLQPKEMSCEKLNEMRGVFDDDGTLLGAMVQLDMTCRFEGHDCKLLGIGGVVTDPAHRRRGAIRRLFEEGLPRLRRQGFVLSALYPFSHVFYRKFGYELGIIRRAAEVSPGSLRKDLTAAASIRRVLPGEDDHGMKQIYDAYIAGKNWAVCRTEGHWRSLRQGTPWENLKYAYVLCGEDGAPAAYWIGSMEKGADGAVLSIKDMAYVDRKGLEMIFAMFRTMNEVGTIKLTVPQDVELRYLLTDPYDMKEETQCGGMLRVLDVEKALAMLPAPPVPGRCILEVWDEQIRENNGRFMVNGDGRMLTVTRTEETPNLKCSINGLSAMVAGTLDFQGSLDAGMAEICGESNFVFEKMLFTKRQQHLHNYF